MHPHIHAKENPDKPAYIMASSGEVVTYKQLNERSNQIANFFREQAHYVCRGKLDSVETELPRPITVDRESPPFGLVSSC